MDSHLGGTVADDGQSQMQPNPPTPAEHAFFRPPTLDPEFSPTEPSATYPKRPADDAIQAGRGSSDEVPREAAASPPRNEQETAKESPPQAQSSAPPATDIPDNYDLLLDESVIEPGAAASAPGDGRGVGAPESTGRENVSADDINAAATADDSKQHSGTAEQPEGQSKARAAGAPRRSGEAGSGESRVILPQPGGRAHRRSSAADAGTPRQPLTPRAPGAETAASKTSEPPTTGTSPENDLLGAFLDGLGVGEAEEIQTPEQLLHDAGALLHALVGGLGKTLLARTVFKSEMRLGMTTIRAAENNPYKFSVGADDALERLLLRPNPAFKPALVATEEAFDDLKAHEMAMIAGLRSALHELLAKLDPDALAGRLEGERNLERLLPMARQARCWEAFTRTYREISADAAEDAMRVFGEAFTRAYEEQVSALSEARRGRSR